MMTVVRESKKRVPAIKFSDCYLLHSGVSVTGGKKFETVEQSDGVTLVRKTVTEPKLTKEATSIRNALAHVFRTRAAIVMASTYLADLAGKEEIRRLVYELKAERVKKFNESAKKASAEHKCVIEYTVSSYVQGNEMEEETRETVVSRIISDLEELRDALRDRGELFRPAYDNLALFQRVLEPPHAEALKRALVSVKLARAVLVDAAIDRGARASAYVRVLEEDLIAQIKQRKVKIPRGFNVIIRESITKSLRGDSVIKSLDMTDLDAALELFRASVPSLQ